MMPREGWPYPLIRPFDFSGRYLIVDLSVLFNVEPGAGEVWTWPRRDKMVCTFGWDFDDYDGCDPRSEYFPEFDLPEWYMRIYQEGILFEHERALKLRHKKMIK